MRIPLHKICECKSQGNKKYIVGPTETNGTIAFIHVTAQYNKFSCFKIQVHI